MNNYLLESKDHLLVQKQIKEIISKNNFIDQYQTIYDLDEVELSKAIEDLDTYSFLSSKKVIIIKNILSGNITDQEMKHFIKYLENSNSDNLLIMCVDKLDTKTFSKKLKSLNTVEFIKCETNPLDYAKKSLKGYKISTQDLNCLVKLCSNDITKLDNECKKLMIYKNETKEIVEEDIINLVVKKLGDSNEILFALVNAIISKDKKSALKLSSELKEYQVDSNAIIGLISSQIKLIAQIKVLKEQNLNNIEIQKQLNLKSSYQVKKLSGYIYNYSYELIDKIFKKLSEIDYSIKTGRINSDDAIDYLIINLN